MSRKTLSQVLNMKKKQFDKFRINSESDTQIVGKMLQNGEVDFEVDTSPNINDLLWRQELILTLLSFNSYLDVLYLYYIINKLGYTKEYLFLWIKLIKKSLNYLFDKELIRDYDYDALADDCLIHLIWVPHNIIAKLLAYYNIIPANIQENALMKGSDDELGSEYVRQLLYYIYELYLNGISLNDFLITLMYQEIDSTQLIRTWPPTDINSDKYPYCNENNSEKHCQIVSIVNKLYTGYNKNYLTYGVLMSENNEYSIRAKLTDDLQIQDNLIYTFLNQIQLQNIIKDKDIQYTQYNPYLNNYNNMVMFLHNYDIIHNPSIKLPFYVDINNEQRTIDNNWWNAIRDQSFSSRDLSKLSKGQLYNLCAVNKIPIRYISNDFFMDKNYNFNDFVEIAYKLSKTLAKYDDILDITFTQLNNNFLKNKISEEESKKISEILLISQYGVDVNGSDLKFSQPFDTTIINQNILNLPKNYQSTNISIIHDDFLDIALKNAQFNKVALVHIMISPDQVLSRTNIYNSLKKYTRFKYEIYKTENVSIILDKNYNIINPFPVDVITTVDMHKKWHYILGACHGNDIIIINVDNKTNISELKNSIKSADGYFKKIILTSTDNNIFDDLSQLNNENTIDDILKSFNSFTEYIKYTYGFILSTVQSWILDNDLDKFTTDQEYKYILFPNLNINNELKSIPLLTNRDIYTLSNDKNFQMLFETAIMTIFTYWGLSYNGNFIDISNYDSLNKYFSNNSSNLISLILLSLSQFRPNSDLFSKFKDFILSTNSNENFFNSSNIQYWSSIN